MITVLFITLLICTIISIYINKKIMAPSVLAYGVFCFASLIILLNYRYWNYDISNKTYWIIVIGLIVFALGTHFIFHIKKQKEDNNYCEFICVKRPQFDILVFVCIVIAVVYSIGQFRQAVFSGNVIGMSGMLDSLRHDVEASSSIAMVAGTCIVKASAIISLYLLSYNRYHQLEKGKEFVKYYISIGCYLIVCFFSSSRIGFIEIGTVILFNYYSNVKNKHRTFANKLIIKKVIKVAVIVLIIFVGLGMMRDSLIGNWINQVSIYSSSGIIGLDIFINSNTNEPILFGQTTFRGIYNILRMFGVDIPVVAERHVTFGWNGNYSNIYTVFRPYIDDFGFVATIFIMFFLGIVFGNAWNHFQKKDNHFINVIYGSYFGFALVLFATSEMFFRTYFAMNSFLTIGLEILFYKTIILKCQKHEMVVGGRR